ncbi:MAG: hypothetical protein INH41_31030 [Myxococcaceae bacterium]|jgi:hypothetical protein|nr:hypothetical protein [Myxococcaceae bacterium]MCA3016841.1 hypothetical protein [Myxococcaceae bacterium]
MSLDSLMAAAAKGPLDEGQRAQLRDALTDSPEVSALAVAEALGNGQQTLSPEESAQLLEHALRRRSPAAAPRAPRFRLAFAVAAVLVAGLFGVLVVRQDGGREKGRGGATSVLFAAQDPGSKAARAVESPMALRPDEVLRIIVRRTEPGEATLREEGSEAGVVWRGELPAGETVIGPAGGTAGLRPTLPGGTRYRLVVCSTPEVCEDFVFDVTVP